MFNLTLDLTPEEILAYRTVVRRQREKELEALEARKQHAWILARQAAGLLRAQFDVTRVVVFGSLVKRDCFTEWSDVDVAAWGIRPEDTFRDMGAVMDLSGEIQVNLVDVETCSPSLRSAIQREGVDL